MQPWCCSLLASTRSLSAIMLVQARSRGLLDSPGVAPWSRGIRGHLYGPEPIDDSTCMFGKLS
jgi:hypothetical protein